MMDLSKVKEITIPEGNVKEISIDGQVVWQKISGPVNLYISTLVYPFWLLTKSNGVITVNGVETWTYANTDNSNSVQNSIYVPMTAIKDTNEFPVINPGDEINFKGPFAKGNFWSSSSVNEFNTYSNIPVTSPYGETCIDANGNIEFTFKCPSKDVYIYRLGYFSEDIQDRTRYISTLVTTEAPSIRLYENESLFTANKDVHTVAISEVTRIVIQYNIGNLPWAESHSDVLKGIFELEGFDLQSMLDKPWEPEVGIHNYMLTLPNADKAYPYQVEISQSNTDPAA